MARLLTPEGDPICQLDELDVQRATADSDATFSAMIPDHADGIVIRTGVALLEMDDGTRYVSEVGQPEVTTELGTAVVRVTGILVPLEPQRH